jgi:hypothetical protein
VRLETLARKLIAMLDEFQKWLEQVECDAIATKMSSATDPTLWKKEVWLSPKKNDDIKRKFRDEMEKLENEGKQVYFSRPSFKAKTGEWLYDFVSRKFDDEKNLIEVFLTMEIEMSNPNECESRYDYNKLLQADSRYKIFVFQLKSKQNVLDGLAKLKEAAGKYRFRSNSDFLLCGWSTSENKFFFEKFQALPIT